MDKIPLHRRASWGKNSQSYDTYMRNDMAKNRSPTSSQDDGIGNFSYDDKHLSEWKMPDNGTSQHLPSQLRKRTDDWIHSGAALDTALERIGQLKADAIHRGWPDKKNTHLQARHWPSPTGAGAQSPAIGSPVSPGLSLPDALERSDFTLPFPHKPFGSAMPGYPPMGMESPPFTPINAPTTPTNPAEAPAATLPDLSKINTQLSPPSSYGVTSPTGSSTPSTLAQPDTPSSAFDEHAWETYFNQVKAEHTDVRLNALSRFKGTARDIDNLAREYSHMTEYSEAMKPFKLWWDGQKGKAKLYEDKVKSLEMPSEDQAKRDRVAKGLPI
jgi:hypothetical protein